MSYFFIKLLHMSLTASYVALVVIAIRLILSLWRVPKIISYMLWIVVLVRLVLPISLESAMSLIPGKLDLIPQEIIRSEAPIMNSGIAELEVDEHLLSQVKVAPVQLATTNPVQVFINVGTIIWLSGIVVLLLYSLFSYTRLKRKVAFAIQRQNNIFETDQILTPFVLGFVRPRIYLPVGLTDQDEDYIVKHEQVHIKRGDHLIKMISFLVVMLHWFNPVIWLSYFLMIKDMEMSCDERVMKEAKEDVRKNYSRTLLALASKKSGLLGPLSFGESNVKLRIRNILNYRRLSFGVGLVVVIVVGTLALTLLVNPKTKLEATAEKQEIVTLVENFGSRLQSVSLIAPQSEVAKSMQEHYSDYVAPQLIEIWAQNPEQAPGRFTSSPWPERIDMTLVEKITQDTYEVEGRIIEITGEETIAATRTIKLEVKNSEGSWLISNCILGAYESYDVEDDLYRATLTADTDSTSFFAGYMILDGDQLILDPVEVLTTEEADRIIGFTLQNPERIAELGLAVEDMPNGYFIHNPDTVTMEFHLTENTTYSFTDVHLLFVNNPESDRRYITNKLEDYLDHLNASMTQVPFTGEVPYPVFIEVRDNQVLHVTEVFLLTQ